MKQNYIFTSGSVTEGHPDKLCDQISDAIIDRFLMEDPFSRVSAECALSGGVLFLAGRFSSRGVVDFPTAARQVILQAGYVRNGFDARSCAIMTSLAELPYEGGQDVDERRLSDEEIGLIPVSEQATVFGFACRQTPSLMPLPIWLAHKLARRLSASRLTHELRFLEPDGKTQVAVEYESNRPRRIHSLTIVAALKADRAPSPQQLRDELIEAVIDPVFRDEAIRPDHNTKYFINPGGPFLEGGPALHSGLTGRKTAVDTYGQWARNSEAALSGKDPSRIDRVGAYAARYAAKNVVAAGLADECEVQLSYTIGLPRPVSVQVQTFGTGKQDDGELADLVKRSFEFRIAGIIAAFHLRHAPRNFQGRFYSRLAAYGHMGRMDMGLPWEKVDKADALTHG
jgi:S-adenosylmethionine synthetase